MSEEYVLPQIASEIERAIRKALSSVQTVNGEKPDENGNVPIALPAVLYTPQELTPDKQAQARTNIGAESYYHTTREVLEGANKDTVTSAYVYGLYDALMAKYPDFVQKNEVHNDDGTFTNYEYVISTGEYNTAGIRGVLDTHIKKPKYLILSGIHGYEKNALISTYRFIRDVLSGHNIPTRFREGAVIHVMPMGTPSSVDSTERTNDNGVNINRNFDWKWDEVDEGTGNYSGTGAASEKETQAIVNWLKANRDAELFIDRHDSGNVNEVAMLVALPDSISDSAKKTALRGLDRVIPHWRDVIGYTAHIAKDADGNLGLQDPVFAYSSTVDAIGGAIFYARDTLGIPSLTLETTALANEDYPTGGEYRFKPETIAAGAESLGNILLEFYEQYLSNECLGEEGFTEEDKVDIVNAVLVALMSTPTAYYSTVVAAVNDVNAGTIGTNADADKTTAVASVYINEGRPYVVLLKDTTEASRVQPTVPMTINLNGHMFSTNEDTIGIDIKSDAVVVDGRLVGSGVRVENTLAAARAIQVGGGYKNAIVNGGQYTAICSSGAATVIYVGTGATAVVSNCEINGATGTKAGHGIGAQGETTVSGCTINMTETDVDTIGVNIAGNSNIAVYMDNCDISSTATEFVALQLATGSAQNNTLYVSNTNISEGSVINIGNDTHKLYIGKGNNFTADDTNLPSAVIVTDEVYAQVG